MSPAPTTPAALAPAPRFDFPGWLPPMLVKELRQGLRQRGFVLGLIAAHAMLLIMFTFGFATEVREGASRPMIDGVFWATMFGTLLLMAPLRALSALNTEIETRTMDLLLLTRLDSWRIVWSKWVSLVVQSLLIVVSLLPYAVVRYFFGAVDLVSDLGMIALMVLSCGVFTAVGLWASGLHRALRTLAMIGALMASFGVMSAGTLRHMHSSLVMGPGATGGPSTWSDVLFYLLTGACVTAYSLMLAVRWFAPAAENHAIGPRLLALGLAVPSGLLLFQAAPMHETVRMLSSWQSMGMVIAMVEVASVRPLMPIHLGGRLGRRGAWGLAAPLLLPGWPSAALWAAALLGLWLAAYAGWDLSSSLDLGTAQTAWLAVLAWTGLVFPALIVGRLRSFSRISGAMYFVLHIVMALLARMKDGAFYGPGSAKLMQVLDWISHAVPTTSFWHAYYELNSPPDQPAIFVGQLLGVLATVIMALRMSRGYWAQVRSMRQAARGAPQDNTPAA